MNQKIELSVAIPVYNEEGNIKKLYQQNKDVLDTLKMSYEILFIDDGSSDNTFKNIQEIAKKDKKVRFIKFKRNFGQTAAMDAGFKNSKGEIIITMDGDLQNDPKDIPKLLQTMKKGNYDVVSGWRKNRKDTLMKHIVSRGANLLRKLLFNDTIHDSGCSLKAYKKECFENLTLYGEMHRFIPALLEWKGFKIGEVVTNHRSRIHGKTKYGMKRTLKGFLDMIVVKFWMSYSTRPMHIFGTIGFISGFLGGIILLYLTYVRLILNWGIGNRPLFLLSILLIILGVQFIFFGILADILIKIYYKDDDAYMIEKEIKK